MHNSKLAYLISTLFLTTAAVAFAAGSPAGHDSDEIPTSWCEYTDEIDGVPEIPPDHEAERARCSRTHKKYRIADDSNQVCYIKTCCVVVCKDGKCQTMCQDSYVKCETIIIN